MATIRQFPFPTFLGPREVTIAASAYDEVLQQVDRASGAASAREAVARYILERMLQGERDPIRLREGALAHLGNSRSISLSPDPSCFEGQEC